MFVALVTGTLAQEKPWAERAIKAHTKQDNLRGELPAIVLEELRLRGEALFTAKFTRADGAGRPLATQESEPAKRSKAPRELFDRASGPDANSCSGCHNQPATGGAGEFVTNIFISEANAADLAPIPVPSLAPSLVNERGTTHIFGAGLIELLSREMTAKLHAIRDNAIARARGENRSIRAALDTKGVSFGELIALPSGELDVSGVEGISHDLIVKPFGQKGVFVSLREFTVNVLNHHHGMQAQERFGFEQTGELDFDGDGVTTEMTKGDVSALVAWQAGLPAPHIQEPDDDEWRQAAAQGRLVFEQFDCGTCHISKLPLESLKFADPGPYGAKGTLSNSDVAEPAIYDLGLIDWVAKLERNAEGQVLVPLFGDLKRHNIADEGEPLANEQLAQRGVQPGIFMTAELWGMSDTAPYGHRNDLVTINEIISAHGGEARNARDNYLNASQTDRSALIAFLKTLKISP